MKNILLFVVLLLLFSCSENKSKNAKNTTKKNKQEAVNQGNKSANKNNNSKGEKDGVEMILVKGGDFIMGSDNIPDADAAPTHKVTLKSFYIDKTPVTVAMFQSSVARG